MAWSKPHPLTLENSTGQFLLYFQFDILLVLWHTIPEVFKQVLFGHCSLHSYGKHNNFFLSRNAPSHSAMISGDTLKMKGLSIFFRSSAPSQVTGMYTRIMTACSRFKSCAALFTALLFNSYSHYMTVTKIFCLLCSSLYLLLHRSEVFRQICIWKTLHLFNSSYLFGSFGDFSFDKLSRTALSLQSISFCYTWLKWAQGNQKLPGYQETTK